MKETGKTQKRSSKHWNVLTLSDLLKHHLRKSFGPWMSVMVEQGWKIYLKTQSAQRHYTTMLNVDFEIKNVDLPQKLKRIPKSTKVRTNKKKLGKSISERPENVDFRVEFGHWEIDTVIGKKPQTKMFC